MTRLNPETLHRLAVYSQARDPRLRTIARAHLLSLKEDGLSIDAQLEELGALSKDEIELGSNDAISQIELVSAHFYSLPSKTGRAWRAIDKSSVAGHLEASPELIFRWMDNAQVDFCPIVKKHMLKVLPMCSEIVYQPKEGQYVHNNGFMKANIYIGPSYKVSASVPTMRPKLHQEYLDRLIPKHQTCRLVDEVGNEIVMLQQDYMDDWLARVIFAPNMLCNVAVVLRSIELGTGKGILFDQAISKLVGPSNYMSCLLDQVLDRFSGNNKLKVLTNVEEVKSHSTKVANFLKFGITQKVQTVEYKNIQAFHVETCNAFVFSSNHRVPLAIDANDRRYFVTDLIKHKHSPAESRNFFANAWLPWIEQGGLQELYDWFSTRNLEEWKFVTAPDTEAKLEIASEGSVADLKNEQRVFWLDQHKDDFCFQIADLCDQFNCSEQDAALALKDAGYVKKAKYINTNSRRLNAWVHYKQQHCKSKKTVWKR